MEGEPFNIALIQVYVLMTDSTDEDINKFYENLDSGKNTCKSQNIVTVMRNLNAKVGMEQEDIIVGPHSLGVWNEKGKCFVSGCKANDLIITNTWLRIIQGD